MSGLRDLVGRTVLVRIAPTEPFPARQAETIGALADAGARVAVIAGLGDPADDVNPVFSLADFARALGAALSRAVVFVAESIGSRAEKALAAVPFGGVAVMENLRFHPTVRRHGEVFATQLAVLADFYLDLGRPPAAPGVWQRALAARLPSPPLEPAFLAIRSPTWPA